MTSGPARRAADAQVSITTRVRYILSSCVRELDTGAALRHRQASPCDGTESGGDKPRSIESVGADGCEVRLASYVGLET